MTEQRPQLALRGEQQGRIDRVDALGPQSHLTGGLLPGDVEDGAVIALLRGVRGLGGHIEQKGGFAHPGLPGQQHDGARHDPAAQHPVQLADPGGPGPGLLGADLAYGACGGGRVHRPDRAGA